MLERTAKENHLLYSFLSYVYGDSRG